jgi:ankyrin repeat protein
MSLLQPAMNHRLTAAACLLALCVTAHPSAAAGSRLIDAVKEQDVAALRTLLRTRPDVNVPEPDGATALHWAANRGNVEIASLLLKAGAKVDAANEYGVTPLSLACENGDASMINALLSADANPNLALPSGETPLMTASRTGNANAVAALLRKGAAVDAAEPVAGQTALLWALSEQHNASARALVEAGADVNKASAAGFTPLMMAARYGNKDGADLLLGKGARINDTARDGISVLMVAVMRGHIDLAKHLLARGADPNIDKAGYTALHWASGTWESTQHYEYNDSPNPEWRYLGGLLDIKLDMIKLLLAYGADVNARATRTPPRYGIGLTFSPISGATPFLLAAAGADAAAMRLLLANGADPLATMNDRTTPLIAVAGIGRASGDTRVDDEDTLEAAALCLSLGVNIDAATSAGETALHATAYNNYPKLAQLLVERGAFVNPKNRRGATPTRIADSYEAAAMRFYRPEVAALLRKHGGTAE